MKSNIKRKHAESDFFCVKLKLNPEKKNLLKTIKKKIFSVYCVTRWIKKKENEFEICVVKKKKQKKKCFNSIFALSDLWVNLLFMLEKKEFFLRKFEFELANSWRRKNRTLFYSFCDFVEWMIEAGWITYICNKNFWFCFFS